MNNRCHAGARFVCLIGAVLSLSTVSFAQVKVITSGGFSAALQELVPDFEKTTGVTVTIARGASQGSWSAEAGHQHGRRIQADSAAREVRTFPDSTTGIDMETKMFPQLGIDKELAGKITRTGVAAVAKGDAEIVVQPVSELLHVPGTDFVGTIPQELQYISVFSSHS